MQRGTRRASRTWCAGISAAAVWACCGLARAADYTWTGSGTDSNFSDPTNWTTSNGTSYPGAAGALDTASFGGTVTANQPNLDLSAAIGELIFQTPTGGWTLGSTSTSNVLTLNAVNGFGIDATAQTSGLTDVKANLSVSTPQTWAVGTGGTLNIDGAISGSAALTLGSSGANGTIEFSGASSSFTGPITVSRGTTVRFNGSNTVEGITSPINFVGNAAVNFNNANNVVLLGALASDSASAVLTVGGSYPGRLYLEALNPSFTGTTKILAGSSLYFGDGDSGADDGLVAGPITLSNLSNVYIWDLNAHTYSGILTGPPGSTIYLEKPATVTLTGSSVAFNGVVQVVDYGATLQLGDGTTVGMLGAGSAVQLYGNFQGFTTLTFDEPRSLVYAGTISGETGSMLNVSGPSAGVVTTLANLNSTFFGTAKIQANQTLQLGTGASGGDGLLGPGSSMVLAASTSIVNFDNYSARTYSGKISGPSTGGTINVNGPGVLTLTGKSTGFNGTVNIALNDTNATTAATATLQLGNGTAAGDAVFGNASSIVMVAPTAGAGGGAVDAYLNINEAGPENYNGNITFPNNGSNVPNVYITGSGSLALGGTIAMNSEGYYPFVNVQGTGPVTFAGPITEPSAGDAFFVSSNTGTVTFSNTDAITKAHFYAGGTTNTGTPLSNVTWNFANAASVGSSSSPVTVAYFSNDNFGTTIVPYPVTFNVAGSLYANNLFLGYQGGPVVMNLATATNAATIDTPALSLGSEGGTGSNFGPIYAGLNVGANATLTNPAVSGYTLVLGASAGSYGYLGVTNGGTVMLNEATSPAVSNKFVVGNVGNAMVEVGSLNGSAGLTSTVTVNALSANGNGLILNQGGTPSASEAAELNVYAGGVLNYTPYTTAGTIAAGDTNFTANSAAGQFAAFNVIGGTILQNGVNSSLTLSAVAGATAILNLASDAHGVPGKLVASTVRAGEADSGAVVNFNGGELQFNNNNSAEQVSFIDPSVAGGVYIYAGGAIIGTDYGGAPPVRVSIPVPLLAPTGDGVASISVTANAGYSSPPMVQITGGGGFGATAVATLTGGQIAITVTNPGVGYTSAPTVTILGEGATTPATATATLAPNGGTGGLTKVDDGTLILTTSNTYGGPTNVNAGTLTFSGPSNATNAVTVLTTSGAKPATFEVYNNSTNNNIAAATTILVGDLPAGPSQAAGTFLVASAAPGGFVLNGTAAGPGAGQTLGGFGRITNGFSGAGVTIGNQTVVAPGTANATGKPGNLPAAVQSLTATPGGSTTTSTNTTAAFNSVKGNAAGTATGALTIGNGNNMPTTFGPGGTYYWKLNLNTGGSGSAGTPGMVAGAAADVTGANWDALVLDTINVTATPTDAFTIQAVGFSPGGTASNPVTIGTSHDPSYSWTIARIGTSSGNAPVLAGILANLSLNTSGMPAPAPGYSYYLTTQRDPDATGDADIVVNYSPAPEPSALLLLAPVAGLLVRRRRRGK